MTKMSEAFGTIAKCFASSLPNQNQGMTYHQPPPRPPQPHYNPNYWRPQPGYSTPILPVSSSSSNGSRTRFTEQNDADGDEEFAILKPFIQPGL